MESKIQLLNNGQELQQQDVNTLGDAAGLADDRVLWELLRLLPGSATPQKGIIPYGVSGWQKPSGLDSNALVQPNGATGAVRVMPFRAIVGSTTLVGTSAIENLRGIRSGYHVGAGGTLHTVLNIGANASGNPRWDLIYATVTPNHSQTAVTRYIKDPTTKVVSASSVVTVLDTVVSVNVKQGTPAASPTRPDIDSDGGGNYLIPIAYVYVANGFTSSSPMPLGAIYTVAPTLPILSALGVPNIAPANSAFKKDAAVDTNQSGATSADRPGAYLPSTMVGGEERVILMQFGLSPASHVDGDVVDDSIDWRNRYFQWQLIAKNGTTSAGALASDRGATGSSPAGAAIGNETSGSRFWGFGQSFVDDSGSYPALPAPNPVADSHGAAVIVSSTDAGQLNVGLGAQYLILYVDTQGRLRLRKNALLAQVVLWLRATAPYGNFTTL